MLETYFSMPFLIFTDKWNGAKFIFKHFP